MAYSDTTYSLDESASVLSIHPSTLLFWEEAFREELKIPRDPRGKLRFEERHLRAFVGIHRRILIEKRSLEETRLWLRKFYGQDAATAEMPGVTGTAVAGPVVGKIDALSQRVSELVESMDCLVEDNRALQDLVGRLIQYVEALNAGSKRPTLAERRAEIIAQRRAERTRAQSARLASSALTPETPSGSPVKPASSSIESDEKRIPKPWKPRAIKVVAAGT